MKRLVLAGIIVLVAAAVLFLAFPQIINYFFHPSPPGQCMNSTDKEMTTFKLMLEDTANRKNDTNFNFQPESCFDWSKATIKIERIANSTQCAAVCGKPTETCFTFIFNAPDVPNGFRQKCLNLPTYTTLLDNYSDQTEKQCPPLEGYTTVQVSENIPLGAYLLKNISGPENTYPKVCTYQKPLK